MHDATQTRHYISTGTPPVGSPSYYDDVVASMTFSHTGFGNGDGTRATSGSFTKTHNTFALGSMSVSGGVYGPIPWRYEGLMTGRVLPAFPGFPALPNAATVRNKCLSKLYDQIKNSDLNLGTDTGESEESKELLDTVRRPIHTLAGATRTLAHSLTDVRIASKAAADAWLTYKLAAKPAADELDHLVHHDLEKRLGQNITAKSRSSAENSDYVVTNVTGGFFQPTDWKQHRTFSASQRYEIACTYRVCDPFIWELSRIMPLNPLSLAWELAPLSFVVDWFYNVGGFLSSLEGAYGAGLEFLHGFETNTTQILESYQYTCQDDSSPGGYTAHGYASGGRTQSTKVRSSLGSFPIPSIPRLTPPFKVGSDRLLTAASLLRVFL